MSRTMPCPVCWGARLICEHCASSGQVEDVRLSKDFWLSEWLRSSEAKKRGISNAPREADVQRMQEASTGLLQPLRDYLGVPVWITGGFRSPTLNAITPGASPTSAHPRGWGSDVRAEGLPPVAIMEALVVLHERDGLAWDQGILYAAHTHLGYRRPVNGEQRRQLLHAGTWQRWEPSRGVA